MPIKVFVIHDFGQMSKAACKNHHRTSYQNQNACHKKEAVLEFATGNSPTGIYKQLAMAANASEFDSARIRSFNLVEYGGLPGENA